jgi:hypothetical protein
LYPISNAHFITHQTFIPVPWNVYSENDYDFLLIDFPPIPASTPIYYVDFDVAFMGPQADFAVLDGDGAAVLGTWHLITPEPASLLLLGLGGLALRMRKK